MVQTRRDFVGTVPLVFAAAMLPRPSFAQPYPVRQTLAEFSADPMRVAALRKGVAVMKARMPSDHRSWFFQASVHAHNDALYAEALARDPKVAAVDGARFWNKCPHFGQSSADFLLWHRAYLYNFERILRDAAGEPTLALPYWDYSKEENRSFPEIFAPQFLDAANTIVNPLYHPNREQAFVTQRFDLSPEVGEAKATMAVANFFSDVGAVGFAGDALDSKHTQLGLIEQRPHNDIHIAVGGVIGSSNGAMSDIPTAAFDPVFWVHHSNIDRLWAEWSCMPGKIWGPIPADAWLDEAPWEFLAVDGQAHRFSRRFVMVRANIPVFYDTDPQHGKQLTLPAPVVTAEAPPAASQSSSPSPTGSANMPEAQDQAGATGAARTTMAMAKAAAPRETELLADVKPLAASPVAPGVRTLAPPPVQHHAARRATRGPQSQAPVAPLQAAIPTGRVLLELDDIEFARVPSSGFAVYLASAADLASNSRGTFVGLLDLFGATHAHMSGMAGMETAQRFDISEIVAREGLSLTLHVEPYDLFVTKSGAAAPSRTDAVRIGKVRFVNVT